MLTALLRLVLFFVYLIGILAGVGILQSFKHMPEWPIQGIIFAICSSFLLFLVFWKTINKLTSYIKKQTQHDKNIADNIRLEKIKPETKLKNFRLEVTGYAEIAPIFAVLFGSLGLWLLMTPHKTKPLSDEILLGLGCLLFLLPGIPLLLRQILSLGKPKLVLTYSGITLLLKGFIPWEMVDGIDLRTVSTRWGGSHKNIVFFIPQMETIENNFHPLEKFLYDLLKKRLKRVVVLLSGAKESPENIFAVAKNLWTQKTGKSHAWASSATPEMNDAMKKLHYLSTEKASSPKEAIEIINAGKENLSIITREIRKRNRDIIISFIILIAILLLVFFGKSVLK